MTTMRGKIVLALKAVPEASDHKSFAYTHNFSQLVIFVTTFSRICHAFNPVGTTRYRMINPKSV